MCAGNVNTLEKEKSELVSRKRKGTYSMNTVHGLQERRSRAEVKIWDSMNAMSGKVLLIRQGGGSGEGRKDLADHLSGEGGCLAQGKKIQLGGVRGHVFEPFTSHQLLSVFPVLRFSGEER